MKNESTFSILRRSWRPRASTIHRCLIHGVCNPGKCRNPRCVLTPRVSGITKLVIE